jgi:hypothetical protein
VSIPTVILDILLTVFQKNLFQNPYGVALR